MHAEPERRKSPRLRAHPHTCCRLTMADVDIRTVAELMGHTKIQMTMRYAHLAPEHKLVAVELLKAYID